MTRRILWQPVRRDELARAETADLVIDHADDPERLPNPVPSGPRFGLDLGAPVADQDCPVAFPGGLESEIVIDATIGEHDPGRVRRPLQVGARIRGIGRLLKVEDRWREDGWKGRRGGHGDGKIDPGMRNRPDSPVSQVWSGEPLERPGLKIGGVDHEARAGSVVG